MPIVRKNPPDVAPPVADYHHLAVVPAGSELIVLAGQVGVDREGELPPGAEEQLANALDNAARLLRSEGLGPEHVIKANVWLAQPVDRPRFLELWAGFHGGAPPPLTLAYVAALARPEFLVEVEVWAARPPAVG